MGEIPRRGKDGACVEVTAETLVPYSKHNKVNCKEAEGHSARSDHTPLGYLQTCSSARTASRPTECGVNSWR